MNDKRIKYEFHGLYPVGGITHWVSLKGDPLPARWYECDGRRIYKKTDPSLYAVLRKRWHKKWLWWRVFLPDMREKRALPPELIADTHEVRFIIYRGAGES